MKRLKLSIRLQSPLTFETERLSKKEVKFTIRFRSPLSFDTDGQYMRKVKQALREGKTLLAIKEYRDGTGKPLKECCDYVIEVLKPKYYRDPTPKPDISNMFAEVGAKAFNNR